MNILTALLDTQWMMSSAKLEQMYEIISAHKDGKIEAVRMKDGEPLKNTRKATVRGNVAIIPITGIIFRYANLFTHICGATAVSDVAKDLNAALENDEVTSIILEINSPGGEVAGIDELAEAIYAARAVKPIKAYAGATCASAAYYIAAAADEIIVNDMAELGSIGVVATICKGCSENVIEIVSSKSPNKRPDAETPEGRAQILRNIDKMADVFISKVAKFRGMTPEEIISAGDHGGLRIGTDAVAHKLADKTGSLESLINELTEDNSMQTKDGTALTATKGSVSAENPENAALTAETVKANHPDIAAALIAEGREAETKRIQSVEAALVPGAEELIQKLKFDGKTTGEQASMQVLQQLKKDGASILGKLETESPVVIPADEKPTAEKAQATLAASLAEKMKSKMENKK
ncbi:S49 family peptidase [Geovibrio ferrireducens]|uniref:S49 family peptidase n=1 Tax=Geovibrio ferrireducens TaxID=46201 RepID=UPI00224654F5|nr:S49 family peptidase [Geovibrio ferrireducens]